MKSDNKNKSRTRSWTAHFEQFSGQCGPLYKHSCQSPAQDFQSKQADKIKDSSSRNKRQLGVVTNRPLAAQLLCHRKGGQESELEHEMDSINA
jgi:hypothetical protein